MGKSVSILIPCYNAQQHIGNAIRSVYEQDYPGIELIVVNDGSTDGSEEIILGWKTRFEAKKYALKYYRQENQGQAVATSLGLKHVTGAYLSLLDADDYFLPDSVRKRVEFLETNPDYVGVRTNGWQMKGEERQLFVSSEKEKTQTDYFCGLLFDGFVNWAGSYMVRTDALFAFYPDCNIYPSRYGQNMQIILPVAYKRKFGFIDEPLMAYVIHENSHSQAASPEEQYQKDEKNQQGYRDIYLHMIEAIVKDSEEYQKYRTAFDASYYRCAMLRAIKYSKQEQLVQSFCALKNTGLLTVNDRICYYHAIHSPLVYLFRGIRKIKSLAKW